MLRFGLVLSVLVTACAPFTSSGQEMSALVASRRANKCDLVEATKVDDGKRFATCLITKCGEVVEAACEVPRHFVGPREVSSETWSSAVAMVRESGVAQIPGAAEIPELTDALHCSVTTGKATYWSGAGEQTNVCDLANELYPLIEHAIGKAARG